MVKDFAKIETFLTVIREKSFSKASAKLGISQPAVTQQIKFIEEYLDTKIIERKKNGIKLTKDGEKLLIIAQKIERCINTSEKELLKIINKELSFNIGASFTIGNYLLPEFMNDIKTTLDNEVFLTIEKSNATIESLINKKIDIALIESPVFRDGVVYREWCEDELVLFSNSPLPKQLKADQLLELYWICREWGSHTRKIINERLDEVGIDCTHFDVKGIVSSSTSIKQTILKAKIDEKRPTVAILSRCVIEDDVSKGYLFESRIKNCKIKRKLYIAYLKDRKNDAFIENVVNYLMSKKI